MKKEKFLFANDYGGFIRLWKGETFTSKEEYQADIFLDCEKLGCFPYKEVIPENTEIFLDYDKWNCFSSKEVILKNIKLIDLVWHLEAQKLLKSF